MSSTLEASRELLATLGAGRVAVLNLAARHLEFTQLRTVSAAVQDEAAVLGELHTSLDRRVEVLRARLSRPPVERVEDDRTPREANTVSAEEVRSAAPASRLQRAMTRAELLGPRPESGSPARPPERRGGPIARPVVPVVVAAPPVRAEAPPSPPAPAAIAEAPPAPPAPAPIAEDETFEEPKLLVPPELDGAHGPELELTELEVEALAPTEAALPLAEPEAKAPAAEVAPAVEAPAANAAPAVEAPVAANAAPAVEAPAAAVAPAPAVEAPVSPPPVAAPVAPPEAVPEPGRSAPVLTPALAAPAAPRAVSAVSAAAGAAEDDEIDPEGEAGVAAVPVRPVAPVGVRALGGSLDDALAGADEEADEDEGLMGVGLAAPGGGIKLRPALPRRSADPGEGPRLTDDEPSEVTQAPAAPSIRPAGDDARITQLLDEALVAAGKGDLHRAIQSYTDVLDLRHDRTEAYIGRGRCFLELGDYSSAMSDFQRAEDLQPDRPDAHVAMGDLYFARKEYRRAIEFYDQAVELDGGHAMARCRRGISHYYRKNYRQAFQDLQRAYSLDPEIPNIRKYVQMAVKKMERGD